ncbi:vascular cell adhesion protein 1-like [Pseudophryne corroboree]|uniref:vascular cell adhesion protein 1-like n=1 Tax=Pseudophryne corroboree TaxID=495146 RepID=UPI0030818F2B
MSPSNLLSVTPLILFLQIAFTHAILLSAPHTSIPAQIGEELHITCTAFKCEKPEFIWASLIDNTLSGTVSTVGKKSTLTMKVSSESDGSYRCTVSCNNPPAERSFKIAVYSFPSDPILHMSSAVVGEQSRITCTLTNIYRSEMMTAKIMLDTEIVAEYNAAEVAEYSQEIKNISFCHDLILEESYEAKKIECVAEMEFDGNDIIPIKRNTSMELKLMYPPAKPQIRPHSSTTVRAGEEISLTCSCDSASQAYIQWLKLVDGRKLEMPTDDQGILTLSSAEPQDSGIYICCVKNNIGESSSQVEITVQGLPEIPKITIQPGARVTAGQTVTIACFADGNTNTNVTLWKVLEELDILLLGTEGEFIIKEAAPSDTAEYRCTAENQYGLAETSELITVTFPPKNTHVVITPSPVVKEGDSVHIRCTSEASPTPTLVLKLRTGHGQTELKSETGQFHISHAGVEHAGTLICESSNVVGQQVADTLLTVQVPPKNTHVTITPSPVVREGDSVQITCTSEASPAPSLVLKMQTEHGLVELESRDGLYNITYAGMENVGKYLCESTNILGQQVTEKMLTVQIPHRNTTVFVTPSQNITEGDTVIINCETHSIPSPSITLQKMCASNSAVLYASNGTFTLHNVTHNDTGTYTINVISDFGNETEVINIYVAERQQSPGFNPLSVIFASIAFLSAGIIGMLIYHHKQAKVQGSYSLVKAFRSKV